MNKSHSSRNADREAHLKRHSNSLYSKKVNILNDRFVGFVMKETVDKIVVFKDYCQRFDIPKLKIHDNKEKQVILNIEEKELMSYEVDILTCLLPE